MSSSISWSNACRSTCQPFQAVENAVENEGDSEMMQVWRLSSHSSLLLLSLQLLCHQLELGNLAL